MADEFETSATADDGVNLAYAPIFSRGEKDVVPIAVPQPAAGELAIPPQRGLDYQVVFDPAAATVALEGQNLVFTFADGARTVLKDFAALVPAARLILPDGSILPSGPMLAELKALAAEEQAQAQMEQMETAAGPDLGGGMHHYGEEFGRMIGLLEGQGVLKLGALPADLVEQPHAALTAMADGRDADSDWFVLLPDHEAQTIAGFDVASDKDPANDVLDISALLTVDPSGHPVGDFVSVAATPAGAVVAVSADGSAPYIPVATLAQIGAGATLQILLDPDHAPTIVAVV